MYLHGATLAVQKYISKSMTTLLMNLFIWLFVVPLITGTLLLFMNSTKSKKPIHSNSSRTAVLLFHSVSDKSLTEQSHVTTNTFKRLLSYIHKQKYRTLTAYETALFPDNKIDTSASYISLIFDDGFENFYTNAIPLLEQFNIRASVFIVAGSIDSYSSWDIYKPQKQLSKEHIRSISKDGHEIGSHTLSHPDLVLLSDKEITHELSESKKILEDITGTPVKSLSFPFGSWSMRVWNIAKECGYEAAVAYRKHNRATPPIIPATGVYAFDSAEDIIEKIEKKQAASNAIQRSLIMPHFAKGTPVWKFRKTYNIFNYFR